MGSGTDALQLTLMALDLEPGSDVVTVPNTFIATVEAIAMAGANPVLVDVDPETRCMDPHLLERALGPRTRAVVPVHLFGRPAPMEEILAVCEGPGVPVVEDAAQAHGATLGERRVGAFGAGSAFSFYPTKNLGAMGDAGALLTDDPMVAEAARSIRHHGAEAGNANRHVRPGGTFRLDNVQAAVLRVKLPHLGAANAQRRRLADRYRDGLVDLPVVLPPGDPPGGSQVHHLFVIEVARRDEVLAALRGAGVGAAVHYPLPIHLQPGWRQLGYGAGDFPHAEALADRILSLPIFPGMEDAEVDQVVAALREVLR